ncbi:sensor histidine kinase [Massilia soli]|uniref:Histidine kinase n=1 Tax=Massilia soli TaxID=2792854 RepID=A0ABS7SUA3_9BURK|nr:histidine kinase [Massilia soli]MBZ2209517.1 histidine kinase [Massilia soli]
MSPSIESLAIKPRAPMRRLLDELRIALVIGAMAALVITLVVGRPESLFEQLVFSISIAVIGFSMVNGPRIWLLDHPRRKPLSWPALIALMAFAAPVAHYSGLVLGSLLFGFKIPGIADYPTLPRVSMIVFTFLGLIMMTAIVIHRERLRRVEQEHHQARLRAEVIERTALQAQLRLLQAQIEPHMLFNTLANLQGLIALDPGRASEMLDQLIQYLRATLGASRSESTTLAQEFAAMEAYLGLMKVRMGARLSYRLSLPPELRGARVPPMLLQPLVENAIVHGLEPAIDGGAVDIGATAENGVLQLSVRDSGCGLTGAPASRGGGIGVATTRERLHVLYGERAAVVIEAALPQGTLARLHFPLEST